MSKAPSQYTVREKISAILEIQPKSKVKKKYPIIFYAVQLRIFKFTVFEGQVLINGEDYMYSSYFTSNCYV